MITKEKVEAFNKNNVINGKSSKGYGFCHFASKDFNPGEIVVFAWGRPLDHQTGHCSIQISPNNHILPTKYTGRYWNHCCDANCHVRTTSYGTPCLVASKKIKKGEEITFSYYMTEMLFGKHTDEHNITCACGSKNCIGKIRSFTDLSKQEQISLYFNKRISNYLAKYVEQNVIVNRTERVALDVIDMREIG